MTKRWEVIKKIETNDGRKAWHVLFGNLDRDRAAEIAAHYAPAFAQPEEASDACHVVYEWEQN